MITSPQASPLATLPGHCRGAPLHKPPQGPLPPTPTSIPSSFDQSFARMGTVSLSLFPAPPTSPNSTHPEGLPSPGEKSSRPSTRSTASSSLLNAADTAEIKAKAAAFVVPSSSSHEDEPPSAMPPMTFSPQSQYQQAPRANYFRAGIGGAGNYHRTTRVKPTPLTTPQLPPKHRSEPIRHNGIGGAGNVQQAGMAVPRPPSYEEHLERERILPKTSSTPHRTGIGGAGNRTEASKDKDSHTRADRPNVQYYSNEPLPTAIDKLTKRFGRKNSSDREGSAIGSGGSTTSGNSDEPGMRRKPTGSSRFSKWGKS